MEALFGAEPLVDRAANHQDSVMTSNLPGGKPGFAEEEP
jgi:hypothetical protein